MKTELRGTVFVATETFADVVKEPLEMLANEGFEVRLNPYGRLLSRNDYAACFDGIDYVIAGLESYSEDVFAHYPRIRVLSRIGIGVDAIDLQAARVHGIAVYNTPAAPSRSVAELTVGFIVCLARGLIFMNQHFHRGRWRPYLGREVADLTIGLLGFGRIGGMVAERLQPFGTRLLASDPCWDQAKAARFEVMRVDFEELLARSDILSLHLPLEPATRHLLDGPRLDLMKPGAKLINTSRGGIVDDAALLNRLRSGRLGGAALDVYEAEPSTTPYAGVPNLIASPHIGSNTAEGRYRMEIGAVRNLLSYVQAKERGQSPPRGLEG